jgi:acyl-CoA synthetase (AMP-forming)/AMP-acid ligase II
VKERLFRGHPDVVDADLADYFGSIPHTDLLKSVARRIVDRRVLHLIKMWWLECPVEETDQRAQRRRTTEARDSRDGGANGFAPRVGPEDLSLLLYTSGTSGRPKGVPRRHRAERATPSPMPAALEAGAALRLIARERISSLYLVPTLYHDLIGNLDFAATDASSARKSGFAGAAMPDGLLKRVDASRYGLLRRNIRKVRSPGETRSHPYRGVAPS